MGCGRSCTFFEEALREHSRADMDFDSPVCDGDIVIERGDDVWNGWLTGEHIPMELEHHWTMMTDGILDRCLETSGCFDGIAIMPSDSFNSWRQTAQNFFGDWLLCMLVTILLV